MVGHYALVPARVFAHGHVCLCGRSLLDQGVLVMYNCAWFCVYCGDITRVYFAPFVRVKLNAWH